MLKSSRPPDPRKWLQLAQLARVKLPNCAVPGLGGGEYHGIMVSPGICPTAESLRPKRTIGVRRGIKAIFRILEVFHIIRNPMVLNYFNIISIVVGQT